MPDDQQIRRQLVAYAQGVEVDADADLDRVLGAASTRAVRSRRVAVLTAIPLIVAVVVGGVLLISGTFGQQALDRPATQGTESRLTGTWVRTPVAEGALSAEAAGTWTMVLGADGALTIVPPEAWSAGNFQPNGSYDRTGDGLRTNVFASESCAGEAGEYSFTVGHATLDLRASIDSCALRVAVLDGRWERGP
jgi:hypothetical protein